MKKHAAGLIATPPFVRRERKVGAINNSLAVSDAGVPVSFYTGTSSGAKFLPLHAAFAVRHGMSTSAALAGLTSGAAKMFHIDDRVGSLAVGKDGDLVVFSGDPFDLSSRVVAVVVDGRLVFDARTGGAKK